MQDPPYVYHVPGYPPQAVTGVPQATIYAYAQAALGGAGPAQPIPQVVDPVSTGGPARGFGVIAVSISSTLIHPFMNVTRYLNHLADQHPVVSLATQKQLDLLDWRQWIIPQLVYSAGRLEATPVPLSTRLDISVGDTYSGPQTPRPAWEESGISQASVP